MSSCDAALLYFPDSLNAVCFDDLPVTAVLNWTEGVIDLTFASWGRSHTMVCRGRPGTNDNTQCQYSISEQFSACHGVTSCVVPNVQANQADPCRGTGKYIQVLYFCVSGKARFHSTVITWALILSIKMSSYQFGKYHCGDKTAVRSSYLHNGNSYNGKVLSLYWIIPWSPFNKRRLSYVVNLVIIYDTNKRLCV